jgi:hypothetical protein
MSVVSDSDVLVLKYGDGSVPNGNAAFSVTNCRFGLIERDRDSEGHVCFVDVCRRKARSCGLLQPHGVLDFEAVADPEVFAQGAQCFVDGEGLVG